VKLRISHPELAPDLVGALNGTDLFAARTGVDTVEVFAPWLIDGGDMGPVATELLFFVRAWGSIHPDFDATLLGPLEH
jgi:hypothetical protein